MSQKAIPKTLKEHFQNFSSTETLLWQQAMFLADVSAHGLWQPSLQSGFMRQLARSCSAQHCCHSCTAVQALLRGSPDLLLHLKTASFFTMILFGLVHKNTEISSLFIPLLNYDKKSCQIDVYFSFLLQDTLVTYKERRKKMTPRVLDTNAR